MNAPARILPVMAQTKHPIPDAALDDRLAFVGTAGSGKTYAAGTAVERLLAMHARVVIADPLGVWWGLRLAADGKSPSAHNVVIFGGPHGDLPLTEHAGALVGETAATMAESCILDLSELGTKAAERRFMLGFLSALYRKTPGDPMHLIVDEADMFAPQVLSDKDGEAAKLLGMMETIVRRGRVKGFIPWLITQRPAVLNKNVLSQADGLIALKLTASQDRAALGDWIEGQADRAEGKRILGEMPTLARGQAVVWLPARGVLATAQFPKKETFDSSRTPERGEKKRTLTLRPLDLGALKDKLAKVEAETKANDPRALKAEIARLTRERDAAQKHPAAAPLSDAERQRIRDAAFAEGAASREAEIDQAHAEGFALALERTEAAIAGVRGKLAAPPKRKAIAPPAPHKMPVKPPSGHFMAHKAPPPRAPTLPAEGLTAPQSRILEALAFWGALGFGEPKREQIALAAGLSPTSSNFSNLCGALRAMGLIEYPRGGLIAFTPEGAAKAPAAGDGTARDRLGQVLTAPQLRIIDALPDDGAAMTRADLAEAVGLSPTSSNFSNLLGALRTLGVVDYPEQGSVAIEPWVWA